MGKEESKKPDGKEKKLPFYKRDPDTKLATVVAKDVFDGETPYPVVKTTVVGQVTVKTFFLGFDHTHPDHAGPSPLLWRTTANGSHPTWPAQLRYTSEADAIAGHDAFVAAMQNVSEANVAAGLGDPALYTGW